MLNKFIKISLRSKNSKSESSDNNFSYGQLDTSANGPATPSAAVVGNQACTNALGGPAALNRSPSRITIEALPMFREVQVIERQLLFTKKLRICCYQFDFSNPLKNGREKEIKRQTLAELIDFIQSGSSKLSEDNQEEMIWMISMNIFRPLPPAYQENTGSGGLDAEEEEPYFNPEWPHLQLVYELLLRYVMSPDMDTKIAKRYVDNSFVLKLLDLFDSEDMREREYLKTILHRIYGKFMVHRPFIRKVINNIFYRFIYETERHSGIGELLEILGSIINGFALPMKEEHKLFLVRTLIPLHKPKSVALYHHQLSYCITQFVEKDSKLADTVIRGLLKYWPVTNCQKELMFLGELEEVLDAAQAPEFQRIMVPLFRQIARCLSSSHFQVAERSLFLWNNDHIVSLIALNRKTILPIIFESLAKNLQSHWNLAVNGLTFNVRKMFLEMDTELFYQCQREHEEKEARTQELKERRELMWQKLECVAAQAG